MSNDRLEYLKSYFAKDEKVRVEIPAQYSKTTKETVVYRFNGKRCGYDFRDGIAWVERKDLHLFRTNETKHMIIHDKEGAE